MGLLPQRNTYPIFFLFLFAAAPIRETGAGTILWAAPSILVAALMIAWAAESAQYFIAQGFALAILAWMQTLPEFAIEAVLAWKQQTPSMLASLTGALRLLTGLGWPVIYFTASTVYRKRTGKPLGAIRLDDHHSVEVMGLLASLIYIAAVVVKGSLTVYDGIVLIAIYAVYLIILAKLPPEEAESIDDLESIPRAIVTAPRLTRIAVISILFVAGAVFIKFAAEPFLGSILAISVMLGVPSFVAIQWIAPLVSEFPEMASTVYFARSAGRAPMALMNMVSSNINQWTLLVAMLPIVYSISRRSVSPIVFDPQQHFELWLTLGQAVAGMMLLLNMELAWWEATGLFVLFVIPFAFAGAAKAVTILYFAWAGVELVRMIAGRQEIAALAHFGRVWKAHVRR